MPEFPSKPRSIRVEAIDIDDSVSPRADLDAKRIETFRGLTRHLPPIVVVRRHGTERYLLADGAHRFAAAVANGVSTIEAFVVQIEEHADEVAVARSLAIDYLRGPKQLSTSETRVAITQALMIDPALSDRELARRFTCSPATVGAIRRKLVGEEPARPSLPTSRPKRTASSTAFSTRKVSPIRRFVAAAAALASDPFDPGVLSAELAKLPGNRAEAARHVIAHAAEAMLSPGARDV